MKCPHCNQTNNRKNGFVNGGKQRYYCKACGKNFTKHKRRGYSLHMRMQAFAMLKEGLGFRAVGRVLGISNVTVLKWVRSAGKDLKVWYDQQIWREYDKEVPVVEVDEVWHYIKKNSSSCGYGLLFVVDPESSSRLRWAIVPVRP